MADTRTLLEQTKETTAFACREYFRPLLVALSLFRSGRPTASAPETHAQDTLRSEEAEAILRERLATGRYHEKLLVIPCILCALGSFLGLAVALMHMSDLGLATVLAVLVPLSLLTIWIAFRFIKNRETIIELKTIRWIMKSVDEETADRVVSQILGGKRKRDTNPS